MEVGILDASLAGKRPWDNLERAFLDRRLPGAHDLTVDDNDRPEHAPAAGQFLVICRDDRASVPVRDCVLVEGRQQVDGGQVLDCN